MIDARQGTKERENENFPRVGTSSEIDNLACCHTKGGSRSTSVLAAIRLRSTIVLIKVELYLVVRKGEIERLIIKKVEV